MIVLDARLATGSTFASRVFLSPIVSSVHLESSSMAAPETWGVAIDVPLR